MGSFLTHLVLEEHVTDILRHFGYSQNIALTFLVSLDTDTIVEHDAIVPDQPESTERELAQSWVGVYPDYLLEQLRPPFVLAVTPECVVTVL